MLFDKTSYGNKGSYKYYIRYLHETDPFPSPLHIKLPKMNAFVKYFDNNNKYMNPLANEKELLIKYKEIWNRISNLLKKGLIVNQYIIINILRLK